PNRINLVPSGSSYSILNTSDTNTDTNNLFPDITVSQSIDVDSVTDNYFSHFWKSVEKAQSSSEVAVLRHRAGLIADFETLEKPLGMTREDRRYIYYIGKANYQVAWLEEAENYRSTHHALLG
ncbi:12582_t:CDS:2, partial [Racocetra fulgida]